MFPRFRPCRALAAPRSFGRPCSASGAFGVVTWWVTRRLSQCMIVDFLGLGTVVLTVLWILFDLMGLHSDVVGVRFHGDLMGEVDRVRQDAG